MQFLNRFEESAPTNAVCQTLSPNQFHHQLGQKFLLATVIADFGVELKDHLTDKHGFEVVASR